MKNRAFKIAFHTYIHSSYSLPAQPSIAAICVKIELCDWLAYPAGVKAANRSRAETPHVETPPEEIFARIWTWLLYR